MVIFLNLNKGGGGEFYLIFLFFMSSNLFQHQKLHYALPSLPFGVTIVKALWPAGLDGEESDTFTSGLPEPFLLEALLKSSGIVGCVLNSSAIVRVKQKERKQQKYPFRDRLPHHNSQKHFWRTSSMGHWCLLEVSVAARDFSVSFSRMWR